MMFRLLRQVIKPISNRLSNTDVIRPLRKIKYGHYNLTMPLITNNVRPIAHTG